MDNTIRNESETLGVILERTAAKIDSCEHEDAINLTSGVMEKTIGRGLHFLYDEFRNMIKDMDKFDAVEKKAVLTNLKIHLEGDTSNISEKLLNTPTNEVVAALSAVVQAKKLSEYTMGSNASSPDVFHDIAVKAEALGRYYMNDRVWDGPKTDSTGVVMAALMIQGKPFPVVLDEAFNDPNIKYDKSHIHEQEELSLAEISDLVALKD